MSFFGLGGKCKQMIKYDGTSLDLSGLNVSGVIGAGPLSFGIGQLKVKREVVQAAAEIAQLIDAVQLANCTKIEMTPKDSPERIKFINQAMESERQLIQFAFVMKMIAANPTSEPIQKALADWVASQATRTQDLQTQAQSAATTRGQEGIQIQIPGIEKIESSIQSAKEAEPQLRESMQRGASFDINKVIDSYGSNS